MDLQTRRRTREELRDGFIQIHAGLDGDSVSSSPSAAGSRSGQHVPLGVEFVLSRRPDLTKDSTGSGDAIAIHAHVTPLTSNKHPNQVVVRIWI